MTNSIVGEFAVRTEGVIEFMKDLTLLVWLTQLGISVAVPLGVFVGAALWLQNKFAMGSWIVIVGVVLGLAIAIHEFYRMMKLLDKVGNKKKEKDTTAVFFNDHE